MITHVKLTNGKEVSILTKKAYTISWLNLITTWKYNCDIDHIINRE